MSHNSITAYLKEIAAINQAEATEFSYRTAIHDLLRNIATECSIAADILQEPTRTKNIGAPDFRISAQGGGVIGYVECKQPGANLRALTTRAQVEKYRALSPNILLTDSWQWVLLRDGKSIATTTLTETPDSKTKTKFTELLRIFLQAEAEKIGDAERLATALARRCVLLRQGLESHAEDEPTQSRLHGLFDAFQSALDNDLNFPQFADTFAQTLVYSLLLAKLKAPVGIKLDLYNINQHIPGNFAVIRDITAFLQHLNDRKYASLDYTVRDILAIINSMDAAAVSESMSYNKSGKGFDDNDDPYIYFYENFLAAYDAKLRKQCGVYYTPPPVVKFIVQAVDDLLRSDFNLPDGLADNQSVTALDFAAGTGTFMLEMIRLILENTTPARRDLLTHQHILKNFYGFELLMSPYAIAHLKLSQFLADNGVPLKEDERINIYLTNTLEQISKQVKMPMMPALAKEANDAQAIKEKPVLVITGNPPYAAVSQNTGKWISDLIENYKYVDGEHFGERKHWLQDDYVKFMRFAQWKMDHVEKGMVAIITNHGFLDNPTFRGMRQSLLNSFDALYFLDLHGNTKKKETAPDGGKDENVFDIMQGVAISLLVKNPNAKNKGAFHADLYGKRQDKYEALLEQTIGTIKWKKITPTESPYLFIPSRAIPKEYKNAFSVRDIFPANVTGIVTARDRLCINFTSEELIKSVSDFKNLSITDEEIRRRYSVNDNYQWKIKGQRMKFNAKEIDANLICDITYRPFDTRKIYCDDDIVFRLRKEIMQHMLVGDNLGLISVRQVAENTFNHVFVSDNIINFRATLSNKGGAYLFPLYRYDNDLGNITKTENFTPEFRRWINDKYATTTNPEQILACIYAILHSLNYRQRYAEFLRLDFPRIPFPDNFNEFTRLADIGTQLIDAHLLRHHCKGGLGIHDGSDTTHLVEKIRYHENTERLYFNQHEYFAPVPQAVFQFQIGGYQPLDKYLKSRKNRTLTLQDTDTIKNASNVIAFTIEKMTEIDG